MITQKKSKTQKFVHVFMIKCVKKIGYAIIEDKSDILIFKKKMIFLLIKYNIESKLG